jgi:putative aldouronate transport system permease protein
MAVIMKALPKKPWTRNDTQLLVLALPTTIWYLILAYLPMFGVIIAFKDFRIKGGFIQSVITSRWVGLRNFYYLFSNGSIGLIVRNTLAYNAVFIVCGLVFPVALAIIVSEVWNKGAAKVYQTIMFFPYFLSWVVVSTIVLSFLSYDMGMINQFLVSLGLERHFWYQEPKWWPGFLLFMNQWKYTGYNMVIFLAAITSLDKSVYEAAIIDGATKWQQIWKITLPLIKNVVVLMFILSTGRIFYSDFGLFYQVPRNSSTLIDTVYTIDVFVYQQLRSATTGMAAASAFLQSALSCVMILIVNQIVKKIDPDAAMI